MKESAGTNQSRHLGNEYRLQDTALVVFFLVPGIGKKEHGAIERGVGNAFQDFDGNGIDDCTESYVGQFSVGGCSIVDPQTGQLRAFNTGQIADAVLNFDGVGGDGFRWELLCGAAGAGPDRLRSQFWRANVDPSDLYVQSLPGTDHLRLRADQSGFDRFVLAGDWTDNGVNAGCIESATLSGIHAANAVLGRPLNEGVTGTYLPLNERDRTPAASTPS